MRARILIMSVLLGCLVMMASSMQSVAQSPDPGEATSKAEVKYFDFFVLKGGPIGFGLIALSVVTIALAMEYCFTIRRASIVPSETVSHTKSLIDAKQYVEAIRYTGEDPSMLGSVVHAGLIEAANGYEAMERAIAETLDERAAKLFRKTEYLNIIGNISPMIGLLGTVIGMILLFAEIHAANTFPGAQVVADRIAIALITTFWGLAVAIPALSIYAIFRNRIDVLTSECALSSEHLLSVFKPGAGAGGSPESQPVGPQSEAKAP